jgi:F-type H+-transporting ATPase subunit gamma
MQVNDAKKVGVIVVTTDKGLCGGMNTNVLRVVTNKLRELQDAGVATEAVAIGNKGLGFLNRVGAKVVSHATGWATRLTSTSSSGLSRCCWTNMLKAS